MWICFYNIRTYCKYRKHLFIILNNNTYERFKLNVLIWMPIGSPTLCGPVKRGGRNHPMSLQSPPLLSDAKRCWREKRGSPSSVVRRSWRRTHTCILHSAFSVCHSFSKMVDNQGKMHLSISSSNGSQSPFIKWAKNILTILKYSISSRFCNIFVQKCHFQYYVYWGRGSFGVYRVLWKVRHFGSRDEMHS